MPETLNRAHIVMKGREPRLPAAIEMEVVALIARGDRYPDIREAINKKYDRNISMGVITAIKQRNPQALQTIQDALVQKEKDDAAGLLRRSQRLIGKRMKAAESDMDKYEELKRRFLNGEINNKEFLAQTRHLKLPALNELTGVSKEMFYQTKSDSEGAAPDQLGSPKEKLKELQQLLDENDEVRLERIVFAKREQTESQVPEDHETSQGDGGSVDGHIVQREDLPPGDNPDWPEVPPPDEVPPPEAP